MPAIISSLHPQASTIRYATVPYILESEDGRYGFNILTATADDNVFDRYDRVQLLLKGAVLHGENDPDRYELSGITTSMIVGRTAGTAADIPVKEKYISELTDDDMYTYVTLKDCEFLYARGSLTRFTTDTPLPTMPTV